VKKRIVSVTLVCAVLVISGFVIVHSINGNGAADSDGSEDDYNIVSGRIFDINADDVSRIVIANGSTGERVHVEDRDEIAGIVEDMNNMQYSEKETISEIWVGWFLALTLYDNSDNIITDFEPIRPDMLEVGDWLYTLASPLPFDEAFHARYFSEDDDNIVFGQIFDINADDVARIEVASGITGDRFYLESRDEIARIVEDMNNMQYSEKEIISEIWVGWFLRFTLYDNSNQIITRFLPIRPDMLEVGDWLYTLASPLPFDDAFYARYFD